jgi:hypothetical protein
MKTISTALYAALAAKSSARRAFVMRLIAAEKKDEKTINRPTLRNVMPRPPCQDTRNMTKTGTARRMMITNAMIKVVNFSIFVTE